MERMLHGYSDKFVTPFLDDILIYSETFEEHLEHTRKVLRRLIEHGGKLKADKCFLFQAELTFLGRVISEEGYQMDTKNLDAITKFKTKPPATVGELRRLLGMLGHFRRFIKDYSRIARPLFNLLENDEVKKEMVDEENEHERTDKKIGVKQSAGQLPSNKPITFGEEQEQAVNQLIDLISSVPILAFPEYSEPFIVHTDASKNGLGAVLYQQRDKELKVLAFASRTLVKAEKAYHANKLEFLALKWAVTEAFHEYLLYAPKVSVFTDNNPLTYVMTTAKLNATGQCWVNDLANYNLEIKYRTGKSNQVADCLSRSPLEAYEACTETMTAEDLAALYDGIRAQRDNEEAWVAMVHTQSEPAVTLPGKTMTPTEIKDLQLNDKQIGPVLEAITLKTRNPNRDGENPLLREWKKLIVDGTGILKRVTSEGEQLVLPQSMRKMILDELHCKMGHLGADRVIELARERVFWPHMSQDINTFVRQECPCLKDKIPNQQINAPLQGLSSSAPGDLISIDFLHLETSVGGYQYILLLVDHFTRYAQAYATRNKEAKTAARYLYQDFIPRLSLRSYSMTKAKNSRITYLHIFKNSLGFNTFAQPHITPKAMGSVNG
jgi:hypothetical protein